MKSQKGVTMLSLILYVASFLAVTAVVAGITTFFYNNIEILDTKIGSNSQYNKINLYMLNECKKEGSSLFAWQNTSDETGLPTYKDKLTDKTNATQTFITFQDADGNKNSFIYVKSEENLYYNSIKLGEDIKDFKFKIDYGTGKTVLKIFINIDGSTFTTEYVVAS